MKVVYRVKEDPNCDRPAYVDWLQQAHDVLDDLYGSHAKVINCSHSGIKAIAVMNQLGIGIEDGCYGYAIKTLQTDLYKYYRMEFMRRTSDGTPNECHTQIGYDFNDDNDAVLFKLKMA